MVIVEIIGGLGNQMFQYAAGLSVSEREGVPLRLDVTAFSERGYRLHDFGLDKLSIPLEAATRSSIRRLRGSRSRILPRSTRDWLRNRRRTYYKEPPGGFDPNFERLLPPVYLEGYFQSEKYFQPVGGQLRNQFKPYGPLSDASHGIAERIGNTRASVAVHVRRGDFVSDAGTAAIHGSCPPEYYERAVKHLLEHDPNVELFVFSDEPDWAEANLKLPAPIVHISRNGPELNHEDLHLMSLCRHFVIANSSFSWWGAWLGTAKDKIVVAPKQWFRDPSKPSGDLVPTTWLRL